VADKPSPAWVGVGSVGLVAVADKPSPRRGGAPLSKKRRFRHLISNTAIIVGTGALGALAVAEGREWSGKRDLLASMETEQLQRKEQNDDIRQLHGALQPKAFKICNNRPDPVRIDWVYATYPDEGKMVTFDSALCSDWKAPEIGDGKTQLLTLNSAQPGCNWPGRVVFFAMSFTRADGSYLNVAGPWGEGFENPDCFVMK
jgi:hypothetical protein